jgi:hypothetical protein
MCGEEIFLYSLNCRNFYNREEIGFPMEIGFPKKRGEIFDFSRNPISTASARPMGA